MGRLPDLSSIAAWGLPGLFLVALAAGSVFPVPSEAVLVAVSLATERPWTAWAVATVGNVLGAATLWTLGRWAAAGSSGPLARWITRRKEANAERFLRAQQRLSRWGAPALLMTWVPIIGDVFVLAAGFVGVRPVPFLFFTTLGKGLRYAVVLGSALAAAEAVR